MEETNMDLADISERIIKVKGTMKKAGAFFFLLMLFEIPVALLIYRVQGKFAGEYRTLISILMTQGYLLLGAIIYILIAKIHLREDLWMKKYKISTFFLSILVLITASPMATWFNLISQLFVRNTTSQAIFTVTERVPVWLGILIIGCLPGFIEETLYRGIIFSAFRKRSVLTGVVISSLCFGLMHMNFNQILYAIYLGVVFALLVEATGSLFSTMILHMLFNAVNTAYVYILPVLYEWLGRFSPEYADMDIESLFEQSYSAAQLMPTIISVTPFAIGGIVLTILLLKAIASINGRTFTWEYIRGDKKEVSAVNPITVFLVLGWLFCLANAVSSAMAG